MKTIIRIKPISDFSLKGKLLTRTEIEYYSDGTSAIAFASYEKKEEEPQPFYYPYNSNNSVIPF